MHVRLLALLLALSPSFVSAQPRIEVPEGYTVELVAGPPRVVHPIMAGFDDRGRLFVAETAGLNLERAELEKQLPAFITMLQDTDGDGKFDKSTRFADKLTFPQGALWHEGALYVASSGGVWRFEDQDNDGVAEKRDLLVGGFGYTGNAADVHGCFLHPDGRIYFVQGRHGHEVRGPDGQLISKSKAGGVFSLKPDGTDFHRHATGGFDNPVELVFTDEGEPLGTVNIFDPSPRKDCLVHWVEGGLYPRTDFVTSWDEFVSTGDLLPSVHSFGHVAVSGLTRSRFDGSVYVTLFNTREVRRVELTRHGATFKATDKRFFVAKNADFHPTDVLEDADGSLLVVDTGGWFRIGCPTSQVAKPQAEGAIYRVRRKDAPRVEDPRGLRLEWENASSDALTSRLTDKRPAVRDRAVAALARRGDAAIPAIEWALAPGSSAETRRNAVWALVRIGTPRAQGKINICLHDEDESVRQIAAHGAGVLKIEHAARQLCVMAQSDTPPVRREAATALGWIARPDTVPHLLTALSKPGDRFTEHAVVYALIQIRNAPDTAAGLKDAHPAVRRGALIALDRMSGDSLEPHQVIGLLDTDDAALRGAAMGVLVGRPAWSGEAAGVLDEWLSNPKPTPQLLVSTRDLSRALIAQTAVAKRVASRIATEQTARETRAMLLDVLAEYGPDKPPEQLIGAMMAALHTHDAEMLWLAVRATARIAAPSPLDARLRQIAASDDVELRTRIAALHSLVGRSRHLEDSELRLLLGELDPAKPLLARRDAAQVVAAAKLHGAQLATVTRAVRSAGPIELPLLLEAFEKAQPATAGGELFAALSESPGLPAIDTPRLEKLAERMGPDAAASAEPLISRRKSEAASQGTRLDELERSLTAGESDRGKAVFYSKGTCFVCHRVKGEGGVIGPDLSTIGSIRTRRDLLEAVAFPSASFSRSYEPMTVQRNDGESFFGRVTGETDEAVVLTDPQGVEHRIARDQIKTLRSTPTSLMPAGLERLLTPQELSDLLEFLSSLR